ncbi:GNAT family N-acetyltransferase [Tahibacter caeni]|uniref:GNAT family N-acetyltransferase n=1 Tax=Tahibacter caeni TaxID=1453545 RepID=UPI002147F5C4|nr:GNAT family N-acetyltransferase [Tahibacter caeni]
MSGTSSIRAAVAADAPALAGLLGQLGYPTDTTQAAARLARLLADPQAAVFVACRDGPVVGLATVQAHVALNRDAPAVQLTLLVVADGLRGSGIGRALVAAAEDWTRRHGAGRLVVTTASHRTGAHAFYERLGYASTGRRYARGL